MNFKFLIVFFPLFFIFSFSFAYNQDKTHPALTDEIVDFYSLSYPGEPIPEEFKQLMIRGAVEEDEDTRPLNHFYDPVYNKGWAFYFSSKDWAIRSEKQHADLVKYAAILELPPSALANTTYGDYSYEQAIKDYAKGDKKRAFRALGHVLHLLEDANVPDHTRDDPHPPIHSAFGSPYESGMSKWSPLNTNIAKPLFDKKIRPIIFSNVSRYFDEVALYSNRYFFSKDTINVSRYSSPKVLKTILFSDLFSDKKSILGIGKDKDNSEFVLVKLNGRFIGDSFEVAKAILTDEYIGDSIIDGYWARLSKHLIPHGAGLVKLFLEQAKAAEKLYAERKVEESKPSFFQKIIGAINPFDNEVEKENTQNDQIVSEIASDILNGKIEVNVQEETAPETERNILIFRNVDVSSPPTIVPDSYPNPMPTLIPTLSPTPTVSPAPTPSVSPSPTPTLTPIPIVSATPTLTPASTPAVASDSGSCSEPTLKTNDPLRQVVINEIAWMGTDVSTADEWLEFKNNTAGEIDFNCWQFIAEDNTPKIKLVSKIGANGYYLLERTNDDTIKDITADQIYTGALGNSGEILKLYDKDGNLQDVVGHNDSSGATVPWYAGDNTIKSSMERRNSNASGADSSSWHTNDGITKNGTDASGNPIKGTPKSQNSTGAVSLGGGGGGGSSSSSGSSSDSGGSGGDGGSQGKEGGGDTETSLFKVVINEIAWAGTGADASDEWIELYNPTSQSINLGNWTLESFKIKDGVLASDSPNIVLVTASLNPFNYFLLERTDDNAISDILADQIYTGALDNAGKVLELRDNTGQLQDKVGHLVSSSSVSYWYAGENNTLTTPPTRKTMERISPTAFGTDSANWQTNNEIIRNGLDKDANLLFGTPKKKNS